MSQPQSDHDPLLAFSIEPGAAPAPLPPRTQPVEPVASPAVLSETPPKPSSGEEVERLRARLDRLEKALNRSTTEVAALRSEVATLVSAAADIKRQTGRATAPSTSSTRLSLRRGMKVTSAVGGVMLGVATGMWFWMHTGTEPVAPVAPIAVPSEPLPAPAPAVMAPVTPPAIVPAAAVTPVSDTPAHVARVRVAPERANYVGALSIDADPGGNVFIDRIAAGKTPMRADNLRAGSHLVWIERDGYRRFTRVVQVPADRVTRLVADLEPAQR